MEENKLSYYLAWIAFFITGGFTFIHFLNTVTTENLILIVLFKATIAYFIFKYLGWGIEKILKWKIPQLFEKESLQQGENVDLTMPAEIPKNSSLSSEASKNKEKKEGE